MCRTCPRSTPSSPTARWTPTWSERSKMPDRRYCAHERASASESSVQAMQSARDERSDGMTAPHETAHNPGPVVTVTPNPSLDHTVEVTVLERGEVQRTTQALVEAGGKGVNVARALAKHGHRSTAILPAGDDAQRMIGLLTPQQVTTVAVPITGAIRTNIAVVEEDGTTTKLNEPGATLSPAEVTALLDAVDEALRSGPS